MTHIPDSYAFRISTGDGPGLVYSGDCGVADDLLPLVRPGDVLLCEAAFGARPADSPIHLTSAAAASVAARTGASRLILTHMQDQSEPRRSDRRSLRSLCRRRGCRRAGAALEA